MKLKSYGQFDAFQDGHFEYRCLLFFHETYLDTMPKKHLNKFYVYGRISRWIKAQHNRIRHDQNADKNYEVLKKIAGISLDKYKFEMIPDDSDHLVKSPYEFRRMQDGSYEVSFLRQYIQHEDIEANGGLLGYFKPNQTNDTESFREFLSGWMLEVDADGISKELRYENMMEKIQAVENAQKEIDILSDEEPDLLS